MINEKSLVIGLLAASMLVGCGGKNNSRSDSEAGNNKIPTTPSEEDGGTNPAKPDNAKEEGVVSNEPIKFISVDNETVVYVDLDAGPALGSKDNYDFSYSNAGHFVLNTNVKLYAPVEMKYPAKLDALKKANNDPTLNLGEFKAFDSNQLVKQITDLSSFNNVYPGTDQSWALYDIGNHDVLSRLGVYIVKSDQEQYFAVQPLDQKGRTPFSLEARVKLTEMPTNIQAEEIEPPPAEAK